MKKQIEDQIPEPIKEKIDPKLLDRLFKCDDVVDPKSKELTVVLDRVPTISPTVNWALQGGAVPGRFYMMFGPESSGKSMFVVSQCAEFLKKYPDKVIVWFDAEESFTRHWVDIFMSDERGFTDFDREKRLIVKKVAHGRDVFDFFSKDLVGIHDEGLKIAACVLDSVQALIPPKEENRANTEKALIGALSGYLPGALRDILHKARERDISWFFISQVRDVMDEIQKRLGQKFSFSGGKSFLHSIDAILLFEQMQGKSNKIFNEAKKGPDGNPIQIGHYIKMKVLGKCRVGVPNRVAIFKFIYNKGVVDMHEEVAKLALGLGIVNLQGKTYFFGEEKVGVGEKDYWKTVKESKELQDRLCELILQEGE